MEERIKILIAELNEQWMDILKIHEIIERKSDSLAKDPSNEDLRDSLAYKLHNLYSSYEDLFKLTAGFFENQIEDPAKYHLNLPKRMIIEIEGVRPRLISNDSLELLNELRAFRHIFRHAYSYELDGERILKLAEKSARLKGFFKTDYEAFIKQIG